MEVHKMREGQMKYTKIDLQLGSLGTIGALFFSFLFGFALGAVINLYFVGVFNYVHQA